MCVKLIQNKNDREMRMLFDFTHIVLLWPTSPRFRPNCSHSGFFISQDFMRFMLKRGRERETQYCSTLLRDGVS
jgi:hypothetical protein